MLFIAFMKNQIKLLCS